MFWGSDKALVMGIKYLLFEKVRSETTVTGTLRERGSHSSPQPCLLPAVEMGGRGMRPVEIIRDFRGMWPEEIPEDQMRREAWRSAFGPQG